MELIYICGVVKWSGKAREVDFLVDSGVTYTVLRRNI